MRQIACMILGLSLLTISVSVYAEYNMSFTEEFNQVTGYCEPIYESGQENDSYWGWPSDAIGPQKSLQMSELVFETRINGGLFSDGVILPSTLDGDQSKYLFISRGGVIRGISVFRIVDENGIAVFEYVRDWICPRYIAGDAPIRIDAFQKSDPYDVMRSYIVMAYDHNGIDLIEVEFETGHNISFKTDTYSGGTPHPRTPTVKPGTPRPTTTPTPEGYGYVAEIDEPHGINVKMNSYDEKTFLFVANHRFGITVLGIDLQGPYDHPWLCDEKLVPYHSPPTPPPLTECYTFTPTATPEIPSSPTNTPLGTYTPSPIPTVPTATPVQFTKEDVTRWKWENLGEDYSYTCQQASYCEKKIPLGGWFVPCCNFERIEYIERDEGHELHSYVISIEFADDSLNTCTGLDIPEETPMPGYAVFNTPQPKKANIKLVVFELEYDTEARAFSTIEAIQIIPFWDELDYPVSGYGIKYIPNESSGSEINGYIYISTNRGVSAYQVDWINIRNNPVIIESRHDIHVDGNSGEMVFASNGSDNLMTLGSGVRGFSVFNINDPANPVLIDSHDTSGSCIKTIPLWDGINWRYYSIESDGISLFQSASGNQTSSVQSKPLPIPYKDELKVVQALLTGNYTGAPEFYLSNQLDEESWGAAITPVTQGNQNLYYKDFTESGDLIRWKTNIVTGDTIDDLTVEISNPQLSITSNKTQYYPGDTMVLSLDYSGNYNPPANHVFIECLTVQINDQIFYLKEGANGWEWHCYGTLNIYTERSFSTFPTTLTFVNDQWSLEYTGCTIDITIAASLRDINTGELIWFPADHTVHYGEPVPPTADYFICVAPDGNPNVSGLTWNQATTFENGLHIANTNPDRKHLLLATGVYDITSVQEVVADDIRITGVSTAGNYPGTRPILQDSHMTHSALVFADSDNTSLMHIEMRIPVVCDESETFFFDNVFSGHIKESGYPAAVSILDRSDARMKDNLFVDNSTGLIVQERGSIDLIDSTFAYNGEGFGFDAVNPVTIENSIFYRNDTGVYNYTGDTSLVGLEYCTFYENTTNHYRCDVGRGIEYNDPQFQYPELHDFSLHTGSPCIDSGRDIHPPFDIPYGYSLNGGGPDICEMDRGYRTMIGVEAQRERLQIPEATLESEKVIDIYADSISSSINDAGEKEISIFHRIDEECQTVQIETDIEPGYLDWSSADLNFDGMKDILLTRTDGLAVYLNDGTGNFYSSKANGRTKQWSGATVCETRDIDYDGIPEVILGIHPHIVILAMDETGEYVYSSHFNSEYPASMLITDMDGDYCLDLITGSADGVIMVQYDMASNKPVEFKTDAILPDISQIQAMDLDQDHLIDLRVFSSGGVVQEMINDGNHGFVMADTGGKGKKSPK